MTTAPNPAVLDANVLVYAALPAVAQHPASRALLDQALQPGAGLCVLSQTLAEFFAVVTNPRRVSTPRSPIDALDAIEIILTMPGMTLLPTPGDLVARWMQLVRQAPVSGAKVFDVQLVAAMLGNGVTRIYTYNVADFQSFSQLQVLTP
jgi:toxin-antitoxin system PIN domain toxin